MNNSNEIIDNSLSVVSDLVSFVFTRLSNYITFCNGHKALWIPTGFAVAWFTIALFRCAVGMGKD